MKNTHIKNLLSEVPKELRLEVYRETLYKFENDSLPFHGLCLVLPCVLWGIGNYYDLAPDGSVWDCDDTSTAFPELSMEIIEYINRIYDYSESMNAVRMNFLREWIRELEKTI